MWKPTLPADGGPGPSLVLLLISSLLLSGLLAYQAQDAARSHRAVSASALRDYAALAGDELGRQLEDELQDLAEEIVDARFAAERRRAPEGRLAEYAEEVREEMGPCDCPALVHDFFTVDGEGEGLELADASLPPATHAWMESAVSSRLSREAGVEEPDGLVRMELPGAPDRVLLFSPVRDEEGEASRAYGAVLDLTDFTAATTRAILREVPLLPPSLTRGTADEAMLTVRLSAGAERVYFSGGEREEVTESVDTVVTALGSYQLAVAVRPEMADRLVIGGLPRSRLPLLLGIFLLTLGLSATAIVQLRRQQALMRMRSGFVASVSHELRTPLAQIRLFSDLLGSGRLQEEQRSRAVRIIGEEAQRLAYLVENVLRFSRSEQRAERAALEPVDLSGLAREIVDGFAPLAHAREARIETALEPDAVAGLDRDAVRQVLLNLLDNAVKYGPPGQTVRVSVAREGARVRLQVDDEGPGIPASDRESIWAPYHRLARDAEAATGGSGIGLAVVRDLVALHGGRVAVDDAPGGGARFVAWFPAAA